MEAIGLPCAVANCETDNVDMTPPGTGLSARIKTQVRREAYKINTKMLRTVDY